MNCLGKDCFNEILKFETRRDYLLMSDILYVGLGGGVGAIFRYLISQLPYQGDFPLLTLITQD